MFSKQMRRDIKHDVERSERYEEATKTMMMMTMWDSRVRRVSLTLPNATTINEKKNLKHRHTLILGHWFDCHTARMCLKTNFGCFLWSWRQYLIGKGKWDRVDGLEET